MIDMYGKCGRVSDARAVFDRMPQRSSVTYTIMIDAYGQHGQAAEALRLLREMCREKLPVSSPTATCALSACSHGNLADEAVALFRELPALGVDVDDQHRTCVVDALARAGRLQEAEQFAEAEGCLQSPIVLTTLLGACRTHRDVPRAERFAEALIALDPRNAVPYVALANTYKLCNRLVEADAVTARRKLANALPNVGRTVAFVAGESVFCCRDFSHPLGAELRASAEIAHALGGRAFG